MLVVEWTEMVRVVIGNGILEAFFRNQFHAIQPNGDGVLLLH